MPLPYENATSGERALGEIQKLLRGFGCNKFGSMIDDEAQEILVQFEYRGRQCNVTIEMVTRTYGRWVEEGERLGFDRPPRRYGMEPLWGAEFTHSSLISGQG